MEIHYFSNGNGQERINSGRGKVKIKGEQKADEA